MAIKVGINGFGRIGRLVYRAMFNDPDLEVVAVNDLGDIPTMAHLLKYDSVHKRAFDVVEVVEDGFIADGQKTLVLSERDPKNLPWGQLGVDIVVESTGLFTDGEKAKAHIEAGAKKVIISAPGKNVDATIVMGVNDDTYNKTTDNIVSNALLHHQLPRTVRQGAARRVRHQARLHEHHPCLHQRPEDSSTFPTRTSVAPVPQAMSMIPTTTGAARAVALVLPDLKGKLDGFATRVPTPDGSMVDLTVELERNATVDEINAAMKKAAEGPMKGILEYTDDPLVSIDIVGNPASSVFDSGLTMVLGGEGNFVKCISWYDNEWGYSNRVKDLAKIML